MSFCPLALVLATVFTSVPASARAQPVRVDVGIGGVPADGPALQGIVSFDARYVAFVSSAANLVPGDTDDGYDIFRLDRQTGTVIRLDVPPRTNPFSPAPEIRKISADGRWLLFNDSDDHWVANDTNEAMDGFLADFLTLEIRRVTMGPGGLQGNLSAWATSMSLDGRFIAFVSQATNLVPLTPMSPFPYASHIYIHDAQTGETTLVTQRGTFLPDAMPAFVSPDGEWVAFSAMPYPALPEQSGMAAYLARWRTGEIRLVTTASGANTQGETRVFGVTWDATFLAIRSVAHNIIPSPPQTFGIRAYTWDRLGSYVTRYTPPWLDPSTTVELVEGMDISLRGRYLMTRHTNPAGVVLHDTLLRQSRMIDASVHGAVMSLDGRTLVYEVDGGVYVLLMNVPADGLVPDGDADLDGLPNGWEEQFGLDPMSASGPDGPDADPDLDGVRNRAELLAGSHPRSSQTSYFAEGANGSFFATRLSLFNPRAPVGYVLLRFLRENGAAVTQTVDVPPGTLRTVDVSNIMGDDSASFSIIVESDVAIVAERTMTWDSTGYGAHAEASVTKPAYGWFLAEGSTSAAFDLFYLLLNPQRTPAEVRIRYLRPGGLKPIEKTYTLPPESRTTIYVDTEDPALAATDVSAVIISTQNIVVERAMYWSRPGETFAAGHVSAGASNPADRWFFAEGVTGSFFDLFLLMLNPYEHRIQAVVKYSTSEGEFTKEYELPPNGRTTVWVDQEEIPGLGRVLRDTTVSVLVTTVYPDQIVVERALWWPEGDWREAHVSRGTPEPGRRWAVAGGEAGGAHAAETYVLISNVSPVAGNVAVNLFFEDGTVMGRVFSLPPLSRLDVPIGSTFPDALNRRFSVQVDAADPIPIDLVVESSRYWHANGTAWAAGTNVAGTRLLYP